MSIFSRGLVAAMEDETTAAELAIGDTGADSAEADLVEATDISADVEAGTAEIEQASADADTLERIATTAEQSEADGGLDPVAAEVAEIAVEAIYARLGITYSSYPALESFSGRTGRKRATQIAVEDIKETVKKIWAAIVNAFQKIVDFVKNFFAKIFDSNRKLLARINALEMRAKNAKSEPVGKVSGSGIVKALDADSSAGILHAVVAAPNELKTVVEFAGQTIADLKGLTSDIAQSAPKNQSFMETSKAITSLYAEAKKFAETMPKSDLIGKRLDIKFNPSDSDKKSMVDSIKDFGISIKDTVKNAVSGEKVEVDVANLNEIKRILSASEKLVQGNLAMKTVVSGFEVGIRAAVEASKKIAEQTPDGDDKSAVVEDSRIAQRLITSIGNNSTKLVTAAGKLGIEIAKAGIDYCERNLDTVGNKVEESEKKKD